MGFYNTGKTVLYEFCLKMHITQKRTDVKWKIYLSVPEEVFLS